jgi:predicted nucleic acid-binding Zn ribbon protein
MEHGRRRRQERWHRNYVPVGLNYKNCVVCGLLFPLRGSARKTCGESCDLERRRRTSLWRYRFQNNEERRAVLNAKAATRRMAELALKAVGIQLEPRDRTVAARVMKELDINLQGDKR